jgi:hypothetical protein
MPSRLKDVNKNADVIVKSAHACARAAERLQADGLPDRRRRQVAEARPGEKRHAASRQRRLPTRYRCRTSLRAGDLLQIRRNALRQQPDASLSAAAIGSIAVDAARSYPAALAHRIGACRISTIYGANATFRSRPPRVDEIG